MRKMNIYGWLFMISPILGYMVLQSFLRSLLGGFAPFYAMDLATILTLPVIIIGYKKSGCKKPSWNEKSTRENIKSFLFIFGISLGIALSTVALLSDFDVAAGGRVSLLTILATVIAGPVNEELIFRGIVPERSQNLITRPTAVVVSSLIFGVAHRGGEKMVIAALAGMIFCILIFCCESLYAGIAAHMLVNAFLMTDRIYQLPFMVYIGGTIFLILLVVGLLYDRKQKMC